MAQARTRKSTVATPSKRGTTSKRSTTSKRRGNATATDRPPSRSRGGASSGSKDYGSSRSGANSGSKDYGGGRGGVKRKDYPGSRTGDFELKPKTRRRVRAARSKGR